MATRPDKHPGGTRVRPPPAPGAGQAACAGSAADAVQVVSISKSYGHRRHRVDALQDVSASLARGTLTAVMGLSGCGKSTLLQCAAGLDMPTAGRTRATVTRRPCTIAGFYRYAVEEELLDHSPAAHVRRSRVDYESRAVAPDRNELGALLVAAGPGPPLEHALISLLALNGLLVSEATGAGIEHLGPERGHRTLTIAR